MTFLGAHTLFSFNYKHLFFLFKVYYSYSLEYICRLICKFSFLFEGEGGGTLSPPLRRGDRPAGGGGGGSPPVPSPSPAPSPPPPPPPPPPIKKNMGKLGGWGKLGGMEEGGGIK